jgi:16S rRNA (cytosine967-C5)-methyltransferase
VEAGRKFAADLLQTEEVSALKEADRRLATELVMGVLRWRGELDFQVEQISGRPVERLDREVATILRMGVYQIQFLERVPKAAAVNEAVELTKAVRKRSATGFVNAVLRRCPPGNRALRSGQFNGLDEAARASVRRATPAWLLERWAALGPPALPANVGGPLSLVRCNEQPTTDDGPRTTDHDVALRLAWASIQVPPTVLRVVEFAEDIPRLRAELAGQGIETTPGRFSPRALVVESGNVQASQALKEGRVVLQDEASQLIVDLLSPHAGQRVLDLCAAPGIKAGQTAQMLGSGTLVTCDLSASRLHTMARLLPPWVPKGVQWLSVRLDACQALPFVRQFERILLDAPCSGTGTLARNPEIKWRLLPEDLQRLAEAQAKMLKNALGSLFLGSRLVYATCSMEPEENEDVVERVLEELPAYHRVPASELKSAFPVLNPLFDSQGYLRTRPDLYTMDGFFAAVIVRDLT